METESGVAISRRESQCSVHAEFPWRTMEKSWRRVVAVVSCVKVLAATGLCLSAWLEW